MDVKVTGDILYSSFGLCRFVRLCSVTKHPGWLVRFGMRRHLLGNGAARLAQWALHPGVGLAVSSVVARAGHPRLRWRRDTCEAARHLTSWDEHDILPPDPQGRGGEGSAFHVGTQERRRTYVPDEEADSPSCNGVSD